MDNFLLVDFENSPLTSITLKKIGVFAKEFAS
jgi:hypothetical protein